jgi:diguanylate cyclase (GGDEF)-like protein
MYHVWADVAARLSAVSGRRCFVRLQVDGEWQSTVQDAAHWPGGLDGALHIPVDGGPGVRAELVMLRPGPGIVDAIDVAACGPLLAELAGALAGRGAAASALAAALAREQRLDAFARLLVVVPDTAALHAAIVDTMAAAVGAEIAAIAVPVAGESTLGITATRGYPSVLVEDVRQLPGEGIIGRAFASGQPLLVPDLSALPNQVPRRRYRTRSYVALPIVAADGPKAVVTLTDKADGSPFDQNDLDVLAALAAPAALALVREAFRDRMRDLTHLATVDSLTGLFNRRFFETRLEQEIERQRRHVDDLALLLVDLDNFKELNDTQGHLVGDRVLREVADILSRAVRIFDVCARYGGEEFVILMPGANAETALRIAERIRRQVEQHFSAGPRDRAGRTVSVGVATAVPTTTRETLIAQADAALFRAKGSGKNLVCVYPFLTTP